MKISNRYNINPIFEEVYNGISYEKGDVDISVTQLIDSPKIKMLKDQNENSLSSDLNSQIPSMLGTILHEKLASVPRQWTQSGVRPPFATGFTLMSLPVGSVL